MPSGPPPFAEVAIPLAVHETFSYAIPDELNRLWYARGAIGMALSGPDTGGSQYFFTLSPQPHLDGRYTVFGSVISGWAAMDALVQGDALLELRRIP